MSVCKHLNAQTLPESEIGDGDRQQQDGNNDKGSDELAQKLTGKLQLFQTKLVLEPNSRCGEDDDQKNGRKYNDSPEVITRLPH